MFLAEVVVIPAGIPQYLDTQIKRVHSIIFGTSQWFSGIIFGYQKKILPAHGNKSIPLALFWDTEAILEAKLDLAYLQLLDYKNVGCRNLSSLFIEASTLKAS